jgi:branched-chain amino acid transport system ATP-binding protein
MSLLEVAGLNVCYGKVKALSDVSLRVEESEILSLIGSNGAGKSSLMQAITGLVRPSSGSITYRGEAITSLLPHEIVRQGIALVPEGRATLKQLTVYENLALGAYWRGRDPAIAADLESVLARFPDLAQRLRQVAGTLSGGQQQMLVIARALMMRPKLLLLDEPSLGLAPAITVKIFEIIATLASEGVSILLVEQNAHAALALSRRAYVLERGRIVLEGSDLLGDPRIRQVYLGEYEPSELDAGESVPAVNQG